MDRLDAQIRTLIEALFYELTKGLALPPDSRIGQVLRLVFARAAQRFAEIGALVDHLVAEQGMLAAARAILPHFVRAYEGRGVENIPAQGPLVIAANHPAACDSVVITALVNRPDYKILAGAMPFFQNLPNLSRHLLFAPANDLQARMRVVRDSLRHLREGGALLIFARGNIEPDPAFMPHPDAEFHLWSRSLQIFLEHVPQTRVLVAIVSGVIARAAMRHPITWLRRARQDRQRLAMIMQLASQALAGKEKFGLTPRVSFGEPIGLRDLGNPERTLQTVTDAARRLLAAHLAWQQACNPNRNPA